MGQQAASRSVASLFSDALSRRWRRGWFSAWPSADDGQSLLYASFHVHPEDADDVEAALHAALAHGQTCTKWTLSRRQGNRFVICPQAIAIEGQKIGNLGRAANAIKSSQPELERRAAADLLKIVEYLDGTSRS